MIAAHHEWLADEPKNVAVIAYSSMHDSTRRMARHLSEALVARGVAVEVFGLANADLGRLAMALVDAATLGNRLLLPAGLDAGQLG